MRECARARAVWARLRPEHLTAYPWLDTDALMEEIDHV